jgi:hypothetical protein
MVHRPARQSAFALRASDEIGGDGFHLMDELDWIEMSGGDQQDARCWRSSRNRLVVHRAA